MRLTPAYPVGQTRTYELTATARTDAVIGGQHRSETTTLRARSVIEVVAQTGDQTKLRLTLTPESLVRDRRPASPPPEEKAELVVGPDGAIQRILTVGGLPPQISGANIEDLAPLLGAPLPTDRVRVGTAWTRSIPPPVVQAQPGGPTPAPLPPGVEHGRIEALRRVDGYDCAVVALTTQRAIVREQDIGGQAAQLAGTEVGSTETAFAFREGFPVTIRTEARATYDVVNGSVSGGTIVIDTDTELKLRSARG
jgi:hypothetical protein